MRSLLKSTSTLVLNNLGTKLISIAVAIVLWAVVLISRHVEVTKEIPLEIVPPQDLVVANELPERIAFRLAGPKAFLRAVLDRKEEPIRVNLAGAKPGLVTYRLFSDNIRLPLGVKVLSVTPSAILIKLESQKRKEVPVRLQMQGVPADGYRIVRAVLKPERVTVRGAETRVDATQELVSLPINVDGIKQDLDEAVSLNADRLGLTVEGAEPRVVVRVSPMAANLKIRNVELRVRSQFGQAFDIAERQVTVYAWAPEQDRVQLDRRTVYAEIDIRDLASGEHAVAVKVHLPDRVALVRSIPESVKVRIR